MASSLPDWAIKKAQMLSSFQKNNESDSSKLCTEDYQALTLKIQLDQLYNHLESDYKKALGPIKQQKLDYEEILEAYLQENGATCMALRKPISFPELSEDKKKDRNGNEKKQPKDRMYLRLMTTKNTLSITNKVIDSGFDKLLGIQRDEEGNIINEQKWIPNILLLENAHHMMIDEAKSTFEKMKSDFETTRRKTVTQLRAQTKKENNHLPLKKQLELAKKIELEFLEKHLPNDDADVNAAHEHVTYVENQSSLQDVLETALQNIMRDCVTKSRQKIEIHFSREKVEKDQEEESSQQPELMIVSEEIQEIVKHYCVLIDETFFQVANYIPHFSEKIQKIEKVLKEKTFGKTANEKYESALMLLSQKIENITEDLGKCLQDESEQKYALVQTEVNHDDETSEVKEQRYIVKQKEKVIKSAPAFRLVSIRPLIRKSMSTVIPSQQIYSTQNAQTLLHQFDLMMKLKDQILLDMSETRAKNTEIETVTSIQKAAGEKRKFQSVDDE